MNPGMLDWMARLLLVALVVLLATAGLLVSQVLDIRDQQSEGERLLNQNRATACVTQVALLGVDRLSEPCRDDSVLAYYDPASVPRLASVGRQALNTERVCQVLAALDAEPVNCTDVPEP